MDNKEIELNEVLTKRNFKFIQYIAQGLSPVEAYKLSGYSGTNEQQPYQLKHKLKYKISEYLKNKGFNQETLAVELDKLISLPLRDDQKQVTIDQKIKILRLLKDSLPESEKKEPSFSRFTIVNNTVNVPEMATNGPTATKTSVIDIEPIKREGDSNEEEKA
jgi:sulfur carrier protein ThiS